MGILIKKMTHALAVLESILKPTCFGHVDEQIRVLDNS